MKSYLQATLVLLCIGTSLACNGYEVVVGDPKSCGGNKELLNITSLTGVLSEDCKVQGSITFETSGFEKANVRNFTSIYSNSQENISICF